MEADENILGMPMTINSLVMYGPSSVVMDLALDQTWGSLGEQVYSMSMTCTPTLVEWLEPMTMVASVEEAYDGLELSGTGSYGAASIAAGASYQSAYPQLYLWADPDLVPLPFADVMMMPFTVGAGMDEWGDWCNYEPDDPQDEWCSLYTASGAVWYGAASATATAALDEFAWDVWFSAAAEMADGQGVNVTAGFDVKEEEVDAYLSIIPAGSEMMSSPLQLSAGLSGTPAGLTPADGSPAVGGSAYLLAAYEPLFDLSLHASGGLQGDALYDPASLAAMVGVLVPYAEASIATGVALLFALSPPSPTAQQLLAAVLAGATIDLHTGLGPLAAMGALPELQAAVGMVAVESPLRR